MPRDLAAELPEPDDDHGMTGLAGDGMTGLAGDGETITCEDNDGLRWNRHDYDRRRS
jgi:hypothetical protein